MNGNFYSNDLLVKIRMDVRMAEAEAYRRATEVEQATCLDTPTAWRFSRLAGSGGWLCGSAVLALKSLAVVQGRLGWSIARLQIHQIDEWLPGQVAPHIFQKDRDRTLARAR